MKVLLVVHGFPPEQVGGTETSVLATARGLVRAGHQVVVVAGSCDPTDRDLDRPELAVDPVSGSCFAVHRLARGDLYYEHWQKSHSAPLTHQFRSILRATRPEVVHLHHWIRLSRDLVAVAAQEGVPAVVTLHDLWISCPLGSRVRPDTQQFCAAPHAPEPCLECLAQTRPFTPWVSRAQQVEELETRRRELLEELKLARAVLTLSQSQADMLPALLGGGALGVPMRPLTLGRDYALGARPAIPPPRKLDRLVLGSWGHLLPFKGLDLVLRAIRSLEQGPLPVELHVAGREVDPGYAAHLRALARGLDVRFHGEFAEADLAQNPVTAVHAMVTGTRAAETWGLVIDEALACGLPMILPRAGAYPEHIGEDRGALFYEAGSVADLSRILARLRSETDLVERLRGELPPLREVVPAVETYVGELLRVYEDAVAQGPGEAAAPSADREARRRRHQEEWDAALSGHGAEELGLG